MSLQSTVTAWRPKDTHATNALHRLDSWQTVDPASLSADELDVLGMKFFKGADGTTANPEKARINDASHAAIIHL